MPPVPPQTMIRLERVSKQYGDTAAVAELSLAVAAGELLMLLGGSGSGKTTTLKMINRLIEPSAGRILVAGRDTAELPAFELRREIGYVFQRIGLFPHLTVAENIGVTPSLLGWEKARTAARVDELLDLVELDVTSLRSRYPAELSGGQAQRVAVARALAAAPRLLLLDEPFGALDPLVRDRLQQTLLRLCRQLHLTAVFVTHDVTEAMLLGDRIGVMSEGRLLQVGTATELRAAPASDYVRELMWTPERQLELLRGALGNGGADSSRGPA